VIKYQTATTAERAWRLTIGKILKVGEVVTPRKMPTKEILHHTISVNTLQPVLVCKRRKLSYKFMAAEAYWIISGDNKVKSIAPYCKAISNFSDNGLTFFGAYGPHIKSQLDYVVKTLKADVRSRQAVLTIWIRNPPASKDIPCTVAISFMIRNGELNIHVFMRSSDAWLGLPYDIFNFSMLCYLVCSRLRGTYSTLTPGTLHLTMASSHLYSKNVDDAGACLKIPFSEHCAYPLAKMYKDEDFLFSVLDHIRAKNQAFHWWKMRGIQ